MRAFYLTFLNWNALRTELRPLEKGQPVRDQLPTVEKLSAPWRKLTWMHYREMGDAREILRFFRVGRVGDSRAFYAEFLCVRIDS